MGSDVATSFPFSLDDNLPNGKTFTEVFEELCAEYMAMGMTYDEFWNDIPIKAKYYRQAHEIKLEETNCLLWLEGIYMTSALNSTVGNLFNKSSRKNKYLSEPLPITEREMIDKEMKEQEELLEKQRSMLTQWAVRNNTSIARKESGS